MIGVFALYGEQLYFNETLQKNNMQVCEFPLENWMTKRGLFIPLVSHAVAVYDVLNAEEKTGSLDVDLPVFCGLLISPDMRIHELGVVDSQLRMRRVPTGQGVSYVRAHHRDFEEAFTAALRITKNLRRATELASRATVSIPGKPIYTTLPVAAWAAAKKKPELIRTLDDDQLRVLVRKELEKHVPQKKAAS